jgi:protein TonB
MMPAFLPAFLLAAQGVAAPTPAPATGAPAPVRQGTNWPFDLLSDDDYPAAALRNSEQGKVKYRVEIGPDGRVSNCTITSSSGSSILDSATCRIIRSRARFVPATDERGNPVPDRREGEITWRLGGGDGD